MASRHIERQKGLLPVDVHRSKTSLLELMLISWNFQVSPSLNSAGLVFNYLLYEINRVCKSVEMSSTRLL